MLYSRNCKGVTEAGMEWLRESEVVNGEVKGTRLVAPHEPLVIILSFIESDMRLFLQKDIKKVMIGSDFVLQGVF